MLTGLSGPGETWLARLPNAFSLFCFYPNEFFTKKVNAFIYTGETQTSALSAYLLIA